jgi:hypothetical protein
VFGSGGMRPCILNLGTRRRWSASRTGHFIPVERDPGVHWIGGWVGLWASVNAVAKRKISAPTGNGIPIVQPVVKSLYWLSYLGPYWMMVTGEFYAPDAFLPVERTNCSYWMGNWVGCGGKKTPCFYRQSNPIVMPIRWFMMERSWSRTEAVVNIGFVNAIWRLADLLWLSHVSPVKWQPWYDFLTSVQYDWRPSYCFLTSIQ